MIKVKKTEIYEAKLLLKSYCLGHDSGHLITIQINIWIVYHITPRKVPQLVQHTCRGK